MTDSNESNNPVHSTPFSLHSTEYQQVRDALHAVKQGQKIGAFAIQGESGTGKSRLLVEAERAARAEGWHVQMVQGRAGAYAETRVLADLVLGLLEALGSSTDDLLTFTNSALITRNLPDLYPVFASLITGRGDDLPSVEQVVDALYRLIAALSEDPEPILIVIDDADEAGPLFLEAFPLLIGALRGLPVLLLIGIHEDPPEDWAAVLEGKGVRLLDFTRDESIEFAALHLKAQELTPEFASLVWRRSAGRPLFIVLMLNGLTGAGRIEISDEGLAQIDVDEEVPHVRDYIFHTIKNMPNDLRRVLLCAAVAGDGTGLELLAKLMLQPDELVVLQSVNDLIAEGWMMRTGRGVTSMAIFAHRVTRAIIYERMSAAQRNELHIRAGAHFAARAQDLNGLAEGLRHFAQAGKPGQALALIDKRLEDAYGARDVSRVISLLELGIPVAASSHTLHKRQADLVEQLGDISAARHDYEQAATIYREMGPTISSMTLLGKLGLVQLTFAPDRALQTLTQVAPLIPFDFANDLRWYVESGVVWAHGLLGSSYDAVRRSRDVLAHLGDTMGFGSARTLLRGTLGMALHYNGEKEDALAHLESARAGWGARGFEEGVLLINRAIIEVPVEEITRSWLKMALTPFLHRATALVKTEEE